MHTDNPAAPTRHQAGLARACRIGLLLQSSAGRRAVEDLCSAAEALGCQITVATDAAELSPDRVDLVVTDKTEVLGIGNLPIFGIIRVPERELLGASDWLDSVLAYSGLLTIDDHSRRLLAAFRGPSGTGPLVGTFALAPRRQFVECKIVKLASLRGLRLCFVADEPELAERPLVRTLVERRCLRLYDAAAKGGGEPGGALLPLGTQTPQRVFAAYGAGLVVTDDGAGPDPRSFYRLCEIISVGAVAVCPELPWIRAYFGDSIDCYPVGEPEAAARAIDRALAAIIAEPTRAAARARQARAIFEARLAADVMVRNLLDVYRKWQTGESRRGGVRVHAEPSAITDLFNKLPDDVLANVAQAVAATPSLQPVPGWRFGGFEQSANLAVHIRHSLWLQARTRRCTLPVDVLWHAGTRLRLHLDNDLSMTLFSAGVFEPNEFALLDRVLRAGMVFIDGGANEGAYTVFAAARVGPAGCVIAIEPSARERERLKVNLDSNGFDNVTVVEAALAEHSGTARLTIAEPLHAGQNTLGAFAYDEVDAAGSAEVALTTLDALVSKYRLKRVDIMKLDLEGAEYRALSAARRLLERHRPLIISELSENSLLHQGASAAMLLQLFEDANYRVFAMSSETGEPVPLAAGDSPESDTIIAVHAERDWPELWQND